MKKKERSGKAVVYVRLKEGVLDPQGTTIKRALEDMGYKGIEE
ncbi:MAG: phosphoribosylformylglycinamidine synthase subunit PurS, partial [candidate division Zixibacteria bacterium]|nr:phosphoribosylformylglycinamidine synthase subunit PurS [candidate division Zixibacteria bacterium]